MKIAIVSNLIGKGLQVDAELLAEFLSDHEVSLVQFDQPWDAGRFDLGIMLEVVQPYMFVHCDRWWWFPNLEWAKPDYLSHAKEFEFIFAKTHEAEKVLSRKFDNVHYVGFLTRNKMDASVPRERKFLHLGGGSGFKNTQAVISAWQEFRYLDGVDALNAHLTVVSNSTTVCCEETSGITFIKRASDEEIKQLQNSHLFHLLPSATEGWGHAIHEARAVGAIILTTDAQPMNDTQTPFLVPSIREKKVNLATLHEVSAADIRVKVAEMLSLTGEEIEALSWAARQQYEWNNQDFKELFNPFLVGAPVAIRKVEPPKVRLAILGNFRPEHSTENDLKWTLESMGYAVEAFQEDQAKTECILGACRQYKIQLLIFVHTHGWHTPGKISLDDLWSELRSEGVRTCSFHLDRYWGLNELDQREDLIGQHPFWHTETVFTADGGCHPWTARGVHHIWLPPGVVQRDCCLGSRREDLEVEIGFIGARGYHPEHGFRGELIDFLERSYGSRFRLFQGFRGDRLNDLYSSVSVCVGDSCFGGRADFYWSDRVPETLGRGGFLIHPETKGLRIPGLVTFEPGNLEELKYRIDYYLDASGERENLRRAGHVWVCENETYSQRMATLLGAMGIA